MFWPSASPQHMAVTVSKHIICRYPKIMSFCPCRVFQWQVCSLDYVSFLTCVLCGLCLSGLYFIFCPARCLCCVHYNLCSQHCSTGLEFCDPQEVIWCHQKEKAINYKAQLLSWIKWEGFSVLNRVYNFTFLCLKQGPSLQPQNFHWRCVPSWCVKTNLLYCSYCFEYGSAWSSLEQGEKLHHFQLDMVAKLTSLCLERGQGSYWVWLNPLPKFLLSTPLPHSPNPPTSSPIPPPHRKERTKEQLRWVFDMLHLRIQALVLSSIISERSSECQYDKHSLLQTTLFASNIRGLWGSEAVSRMNEVSALCISRFNLRHFGVSLSSGSAHVIGWGWHHCY